MTSTQHQACGFSLSLRKRPPGPKHPPSRSAAMGKERRMPSAASNAAEEQRQAAEESRECAEGQRRTAEQGRQVAEHARVVQAKHHQAAEAQRQLMEEMRKAMEDIRVVAEQMRASAEIVRQLTEGKTREHEARLQHIEQLLHLTISEFQEALVKQWQLTNEATTSAQKILHTAEQLLQTAQEKAR
jgi:hypothetical protein